MTTEKKAPGYTAAWNAYVEGLARVTQQLNDVEIELSVATGAEAALHNDRALYMAFARVRCESLVGAILEEASKRLGPGDSAGLEIDKRAIEEGVNVVRGGLGNLNCWETFDPDRIWIELERCYGNGQGFDVARRQAATTLVQQFRLERRPPKRVRGRLEISQSIYCDYGPSGRVLKDARSVLNALKALHAVAVWGELPQVANRLEVAQQGVWDRMEVVSRQKLEMGYLTIVTMYEQWTYQLHGEFGNRFQEFIAAFGQEALES